MNFTYMVHNWSKAMFKHLSPDVISLTSAYVKNKDESTTTIPHKLNRLVINVNQTLNQLTQRVMHNNIIDPFNSFIDFIWSNG